MGDLNATTGCRTMISKTVGGKDCRGTKKRTARMVNREGRELLAFCYALGLKILNGKCYQEQEGEYNVYQCKFLV